MFCLSTQVFVQNQRVSVANRSNQPPPLVGSVSLPSGSDIVGSAVDARGLLYLTDAAARTLTVYGPILPYGPTPVAIKTVGRYAFATAVPAP